MGGLRIQPDTPLPQLALVLAGIASGESRLAGLAASEDTAVVAKALRAMGAVIREEAGRLTVFGTGNGCLLEPEEMLDFSRSAAGLCLAMGVVGTYDMTTRLNGIPAQMQASACSVLDHLRRMGVQVEASEGDRLPVTLRGPRAANPATCQLVDASEEVKAAVLLAGLNTPGVTTVIEPYGGSDRVERLFAVFGARIDNVTQADGSRQISLEGQVELTGADLEICA